MAQLRNQANMNRSIRIATVYRKDAFEHFSACDMSLIRWLKISESLARCGYEVDMVVTAASGLNGNLSNFRYLPLNQVDWSRYDVIKTLFHDGFDCLNNAGGGHHPFIISKMGSVVGRSDQTEGVHFFAQERSELFETQIKINQQSRYITVLTTQSRELWEREHGRSSNLLLVPTGVDREIPPPRNNPYGSPNGKIAVYIGNIYDGTQRDINLLWQKRLNLLGSLLKQKGIKLFFVGPGKTDQLDRAAVTCVGPVDVRRIWDYQYFADVGIVLAQGRVQHNESSKLYYYLRTGLPVVSEMPIPNNHILREADLGFISQYGDDRMMAEMVQAAVFKKWDRERAVDYMLKNHTWDQRAQVYDRLIKKELRAD